MNDLYAKFYKMVTGEDAPFSDGEYTYYKTPQKYAMDFSSDDKPLYAVPNSQVGLMGYVNRAIYPDERRYAEVLEENNRRAAELERAKGGVPYYEDDFKMMNTAYAGKRERRND